MRSLPFRRDSSRTPTQQRTSHRTRSTGQSLVELALILPIFTVLMVTASDFARAFSSYIAISSAAREGAMYASLSGELCGTSPSGNDYQDTALDEYGSSAVTWGVTPTVSCQSGDENRAAFGAQYQYEWVAVSVDYTFSPLVPFGPIPDAVAMERTVRMRAIN